MAGLIPSPAPQSRSPFDAIRHEDDRGEFWLARDLMSLLGYERWERFADAIERAKISCDVTGHHAADHFRGAAKMVPIGSGATRQVEDVRLTRYACYLVAMNGDVRKAQVAAAQAYFAVQTYRAEQMLPPPAADGPTGPDPITHMLEAILDNRRRLLALEGVVPRVAALESRVEALALPAPPKPPIEVRRAALRELVRDLGEGNKVIERGRQAGLQGGHRALAAGCQVSQGLAHKEMKAARVRVDRKTGLLVPNGSEP